MMDTETRRRIESEMERLKEALDKRGISWEQHNPFVSFSNSEGECWVFPSQTYDGKLCVRYTGKTWCDTAEEALKACGVTGDE